MKLIILDRDGVINYDSDAYIKSPEEWRPIPGSLEAISRLCQAGYKVAVATNQSGIGRGYFDVATLAAIHQKMVSAIAETGGKVHFIAYCPHVPEDNCGCRKPQPGLLHQIAAHFCLDSFKGVAMVGDNLKDLQVAAATGCTPILVQSGKGLITMRQGDLPVNTAIFTDLEEFTDKLLC
jgi:D-glycero-D-manno-heptose 1,7-bisphosphate phosphatase